MILGVAIEATGLGARLAGFIEIIFSILSSPSSWHSSYNVGFGFVNALIGRAGNHHVTYNTRTG